MKTKARKDWNYRAWQEGPKWGSEPATKQEFLAHVERRGVKLERLRACFGVGGETVAEVAAELARWHYGWDKAICVVEFVWAHLPYSEQKRS